MVNQNMWFPKESPKFWMPGGIDSQRFNL